jgi:hypothetical protein
MELVGAVAGGPWSDHPLCTPPVLALVARTVNDHTSARARPLLAPLVPYLITEYDEEAEARSDIAVCLAILDIAEPSMSADSMPRLDRRLHQVMADSSQRRIRTCRRRHRVLSITDAALHAVLETVDAAQYDETLRLILVTAINAQRATGDLSPISSAPPTAPDIAGTITVLTRWARPLGADWHELAVTADSTSFPTWLTEAWRELRATSLRSA